MYDTREGLNATEVANLLGLSRPMVFRLLDREVRPIPSFRVGTRRIVPRQSLLEWMAAETEAQSK